VAPDRCDEPLALLLLGPPEATLSGHDDVVHRRAACEHLGMAVHVCGLDEHAPQAGAMLLGERGRPIGGACVPGTGIKEDHEVDECRRTRCGVESVSLLAGGQ
jgi:hypothetical protein